MPEGETDHENEFFLSVQGHVEGWEYHHAFQEKSILGNIKTLPSCLQEAPGVVASPGKPTARRTDKQRTGEDALGPRKEGEVTLGICSGRLGRRSARLPLSGMGDEGPS